MAALTSGQYNAVFSDGQCDKTALYTLKNVTAGDTADLSGHFAVIKRAGLISATGVTIASCPIAGTVITVPAGPAADGVWVLAVGVSA
jgi:hypothetical protein